MAKKNPTLDFEECYTRLFDRLPDVTEFKLGQLVIAKYEEENLPDSEYVHEAQYTIWAVVRINKASVRLSTGDELFIREEMSIPKDPAKYACGNLKLLMDVKEEVAPTPAVEPKQEADYWLAVSEEGVVEFGSDIRDLTNDFINGQLNEGLPLCKLVPVVRIGS